MTATLWIVGTPLDETARLDEGPRRALGAATVVVGESRSVTMGHLKRAEVPGLDTKAIFFLDPPRPAETEAMEAALRGLAAAGGNAALLTDTGMPCLFDPGRDVLALCRKLGFAIRTAPAPTSWGTAAAASGFSEPFLVAGFPPRDDAERGAFFRALARRDEAIVLMDTPYRFKLSLKQAADAFSRRPAFLAWELASEGERLFWGTPGDIGKEAARLGLEKGEFVLVIGPPPPGKR